MRHVKPLDDIRMARHKNWYFGRTRLEQLYGNSYAHARNAHKMALHITYHWGESLFLRSKSSACYRKNLARSSALFTHLPSLEKLDKIDKQPD